MGGGECQEAPSASHSRPHLELGADSEDENLRLAFEELKGKFLLRRLPKSRSRATSTRGSTDAGPGMVHDCKAYQSRFDS